MKKSPEEQRIIERMLPGVFCRDGFLGSDRRSLGEILDADNSKVIGLGVTHKQIAAVLEGVLDRSVAACGGPADVADGIVAEFHEAMGRIPCPFGDGVYHKGEVVLTDRSTGRSTNISMATNIECHFTPLSVHMIAEHGFYQGVGSAYRIEPDVICRLLGIVGAG